ncbi:MAG: gliding motility protein GldC [Calditrichaeota bacterium]|nr:MAG: gliding motility protein GldC [Calditrichota bacterium]
MSKEIRFFIQLDENNMPTKLEWEATDADFPGRRECTSLMIRLWDKEEKNTMNIDLWTPEMLVQHMKIHFYHNFLSMADTLQRATGEVVLARMIHDFANEFAQKAGLKKAK